MPGNYLATLNNLVSIYDKKPYSRECTAGPEGAYRRSHAHGNCYISRAVFGHRVTVSNPSSIKDGDWILWREWW